jgi:nucleoside-diphosphate-sugar epimerase
VREVVCVTGGTGFVGAHSVAAILLAGHRVRLLVRDGSAVRRALEPLGIPTEAISGAVELVHGDVLDEEAVARAVRGADTVLHAAGVYTFDSRRRGDMARTNESGTAIVLEQARRAAVRRTVHVSTVGALFPASGPLDADTPVGEAHEPYLASKAAAERVARRHQDDGDPVVITYPPALLGPNDPRIGDQTGRLRDTLRGLTPIWPAGGFPLGDVRDTAALHASLVGGAGPGRYFGPGRYVLTGEYLETLRAVTGRRLPAVRLPARALLPVGAFASALRRVWPWHIPAEYGAILTCACATPVRGTAPTGGVDARPLAETLVDTVGWLYRAGLISDRAAGRVADREAVAAH